MGGVPSGDATSEETEGIDGLEDMMIVVEEDMMTVVQVMGNLK